MVRAPSSEIMETLQTVAAACPAREGSCVTARRTCPGSQDQGEGRGSRGLWAWRGCQPCTRLWPVLGPVMTPTPCLAGWPPSGLPLPRPFPEACPSPLPGLPGPPPAGVPRLTHGPAQPSPARGAPRVCSGCAPCAASIGAGSRSCPTSPPGSKWVTPHLQSALRFACGRRPPNPAASGGSQLAAASGQGRGVAPGLSAAGPSRPAPAGARRAGGGAAGGARRGRGPRGAGRGRAGAAIGRRGAGRPERRGGVRASREGRAGRGCGARAGVRGPPRVLAERRAGCPRGPGRGARRPRAMRRSSTDESTYRRSPSPPGKEPGFARGGPFFGLHASPGPKAAQARYTSPKGNKYVVFYLDLSFIFLLELKRCSMARGCLQGVKYLMFAFNLLFWVSGGGPGSPLPLGGVAGHSGRWLGVCLGSLGPGQRGSWGFRYCWGPPSLHPGRPPCISSALSLAETGRVPHLPWGSVGPRSCSLPGRWLLLRRALALRGHSLPSRPAFLDPGTALAEGLGGGGAGRASPPLDRLLGRTGAGGQREGCLALCCTSSQVGGFSNFL